MQAEVVERQDSQSEKDWIPFGFTIRPAQHQRLQKLSDKEDTPMSYLIRQAIERLLRDAGV